MVDLLCSNIFSVLISVARREVQKRLPVEKVRFKLEKVRLKLEKVSGKCYFHVGA